MRLPWNRKEIEKVFYPDGSSYVKIKDFNPVITYRINSYRDLWTLAQIKEVYDFNEKPLSIIIPNLLDAQADRRFNSNEPNSLKMICQFINNLQFKEVSIFHPHNAEVVESLIDRVKIIDNSEFINKVLEEVSNSREGNGFYNQDNLVLMSTDAGGFKPLMKLCDKIHWKGETYSAAKSRTYFHGASQLIQIVDKTDFEGKDILIIDDICVKGGTFIGLAKILKNKNCGNLYLAVSHMTVLDFNEELCEVFDKIFITDSKGLPHKEYSSRGINLEIINQFE